MENSEVTYLVMATQVNTRKDVIISTYPADRLHLAEADKQAFSEVNDKIFEEEQRLLLNNFRVVRRTTRMIIEDEVL